jgi:hypothetical protein
MFDGCTVSNGRCVSQSQERTNMIVGIATTVLGGIAERIFKPNAQAQTQTQPSGGFSGLLFSLTGGSSNKSGDASKSGDAFQGDIDVSSWWKGSPATKSEPAKKETSNEEPQG